MALESAVYGEYTSQSDVFVEQHFALIIKVYHTISYFKKSLLNPFNVIAHIYHKSFSTDIMN